MKFDASDFEAFPNWPCMTLAQNLSYGITVSQSSVLFKLLSFLTPCTAEKFVLTFGTLF